MKIDKVLIGFIVIAIVFFGIIGGYIFCNNFIQKEETKQEKQSKKKI